MNLVQFEKITVYYLDKFSPILLLDVKMCVAVVFNMKNYKLIILSAIFYKFYCVYSARLRCIGSFLEQAPARTFRLRSSP